MNFELWAVVATGCEDCGRPVAVMGVCATRNIAEAIRDQTIDEGRTGVPPLCLRVTIHRVGAAPSPTGEVVQAPSENS